MGWLGYAAPSMISHKDPDRLLRNASVEGDGPSPQPCWKSQAEVPALPHSRIERLRNVAPRSWLASFYSERISISLIQTMVFSWQQIYQVSLQTATNRCRFSRRFMRETEEAVQQWIKGFQVSLAQYASKLHLSYLWVLRNSLSRSS